MRRQERQWPHKERVPGIRKGARILKDRSIQMGQRTMVKLSASDGCVFLWTVSRGFRYPHRFGISDRKLQVLEDKSHIIVSDIHSFAELQLGRSVKEGNGDMLTVDFTWLSDSGFRRVAGREETIHLPYRQFQEKLEESRKLGGTGVGMLSVNEKGTPRIEFQSRKNLREVAERKVLRKKLGRFLNNHFSWKGSRRIVVYDDFVPYSFFFREERLNGNGICGGIILHGQDDLKKASYGMHT